MLRKNLLNVQQAIVALRNRTPHRPPALTLALPQRGISSTASQHKEKPSDPTAPENSKSADLSQVDKSKNTKKGKKEPSVLAEIRQIQKMSVEELKEVILSAGYELPDCTCTWPDDYDPEGEFMERMEKSIKNREKRERREQRKREEQPEQQSEQKGSRRGGR